MKAIFFGNNIYDIDRVYSLAQKKELHDLYGVERVYSKDDLGSPDLLEAELIFSTWGMCALSETEISEYLPRLKAVFYAAGPFLRKGVKVFSAWQANAIPVIEYTVAQITLANKGFFRLPSIIKSRGYSEALNVFKHYKGNYNTKVGILGDGAIGYGVIERLRKMKLSVYVFSITMNASRAGELGVKLATVDEIFEDCDIISNHLPDNVRTKGIISARLINKMSNYSTFINTGRGAQVDEEALINKLVKDPTITALLDVTDPEPPREESLLYKLPNVFLTPHIAGSAGNEVHRLAEYMIDECERFVNERPLRFEIDEKMLRTMA